MDFNESQRILLIDGIVGLGSSLLFFCFYSMSFAVCLATSVGYCQCQHRLSVGLSPGRGKKKKKKSRVPLSQAAGNIFANFFSSP